MIDSRASGAATDGERLFAAVGTPEPSVHVVLRSPRSIGVAMPFAAADGNAAGTTAAQSRSRPMLRSSGTRTIAFSGVRAPIPAITAMVQLGMAQTDLGLLCGAALVPRRTFRSIGVEQCGDGGDGRRCARAHAPVAGAVLGGAVAAGRTPPMSV